MYYVVKVSELGAILERSPGLTSLNVESTAKKRSKISPTTMTEAGTCGRGGIKRVVVLIVSTSVEE